MKKAFSTLVIFAFGISSFAQTKDVMVVEKNDGNSVRIYTSDVKRVWFDEEEMPDNTKGTLNGHDWVDLGLPSGTKWATANLGASKPEYYGWHVAWGETDKKTTYTWESYENCSLYDDIVYFSKYNCTSGHGKVDNKKTLEMSDDAARVRWGSTWRMPTRAEMIELVENCTWRWTTENGISGYSFKSKVNDNSIFLPAAGLWGDSFDDSSAGEGYYWTSTLDAEIDDRCMCAYYLGFSYSGIHSPEYNSSPRCLGQSIRPVTK